MANDTIQISFPDCSAAEANRLSASLEGALANVSEIGDVQIIKNNSETQDIGTILSVVLAAPAVIAAVKAIHAWANRNNQSSLRFENSSGLKFEARNLESNDVSSVVDSLKSLTK